MSVFVEMPREAYPKEALTPFKPRSDFTLDNAKAMMWLSQLAYETAHRDKVEDILEAWNAPMRQFVPNDPGTGLPPHSACVVIAEGRGATFVTFAGSDPGKVIDWVTDFEAMPSPKDLHSGFEKAVETVWPLIEPVIANRATPEEPVFFTGHSLGGALAILAAARAAQLQTPPQIVAYTFGSPRNGGAKFFGNYPLGDTTFRLVHGTDIVPTVPLTLLNVYRHVGCAIKCKSGGLFDPSTIMKRDGNKPDILESALEAGASDIRPLALLELIEGIGPGLRNRLATFLPRMIRDHVPASYFHALSIAVP